MLTEYLKDMVQEMRNKSAVIRRDFATHRLSAGDNREDLGKLFLTVHLPNRLRISTS